MTRSLADDWDRAYAKAWAPWDIGRPQPAFVRLADEGEIISPVLDSGCGTGEHALMLAERGMEVVGIDLAPTAIERAQEKAAQRGLRAEFVRGDVLELASLGRRFRTVLDSGVFHVFADDDRARYVASLASVVEAEGLVHLLCFSEKTPGDYGPRRVTQEELHAAFSDGWAIERIDETRFDVLDSWPGRRPHAWLVRIRRSEPYEA